ncbi:MAG: HAMP domain-containing protein [Desulfobacterales bacterium]|nr:HAMP domain-containing protein [Deltaproteobacteria bacterium]NNL76964.1 HAMP domain-containing protein [Desulfobacterales bacterium]
MKRTLLWKLLGINVIVIVFVIIVVWLSVDYLAAGYFVTLMEEYNISPDSSHDMFVASVHRYLVWSSIAAMVLAVALGFMLVKRALGPLTQMTGVASRISLGDYSGRVPIITRDEVGQLAEAFNGMAESLQHIEQLRKTMIMDVAHELRTPLTNIQGYLEALIDEVATPSRKNFELLLEETMRLVHLVEGVLRLAEADAARTDLHKSNIRLSDVITRVMEQFKPQFAKKTLQVETNYIEDKRPLHADLDKISQVISNLLQNALQYTPERGKVRVFTESLADELKVVFANTGGELSQEDLPFIFERFYRAEKSRSRDHGGAGIGLAIVKELIEAHNGRIGAAVYDNEIQVWFTLPV